MPPSFQRLLYVFVRNIVCLPVYMVRIGPVAEWRDLVAAVLGHTWHYRRLERAWDPDGFLQRLKRHVVAGWSARRNNIGRELRLASDLNGFVWLVELNCLFLSGFPRLRHHGLNLGQDLSRLVLRAGQWNESLRQFDAFDVDPSIRHLIHLAVFEDQARMVLAVLQVHLDRRPPPFPMVRHLNLFHI